MYFSTGCSIDYGFLKLDGGVKQTDRMVSSFFWTILVFHNV